MTLAISRTAPFRRLQSRIGSTTYRLNTILVGLQNVAAGAGSTGAVAVTWSKPATLEKAKQVADQARIFACAGALTLAEDVFDAFIRDIVREEWLAFDQKTISIATKAETRKKNEGGDYSLGERAEAICAELNINQTISIAALDLMAKWRNVVAHSGVRAPRLEPSVETTLRDAAQHFYDKYSHLDIALAIKNFTNRKVPVAKEVTSLVAIAVNLSRAIDEAAIRRVATTSDDAEHVASRMLKYHFKGDLERRVPPYAELAELWQGSVERRRENLLKIFARFGVVESSNPISAPVTDGYVLRICGMDRDEAASFLEIKREI